MTPYFYKIKHIPTGKYYIGSQYGENADPKNLLKTYITSSKLVRSLVESSGIHSFEIIKITIRDDAREYEAKFLKRLYRVFGKEVFLNKMLNRNISPGILLTPEIIEKANIKRRVSNALSAKRLFETGQHNFQKFKAGDLEHVKKQRSERMQGNTLGSLKIISDEYRQKQAIGSRGNTNVRGTKWWTNGIINKRSKECPGKEFHLGTTKRITQ
jgi:hypothetical protein